MIQPTGVSVIITVGLGRGVCLGFFDKYAVADNWEYRGRSIVVICSFSVANNYIDKIREDMDFTGAISGNLISSDMEAVSFA